MPKKFFWAIQDSLRQKQPLPPLDEIVRCYPGWDLDHEALENEYNAVLKDGLPRRTTSEMYRRDMEDKQIETDETWLATLQHEAYFVENEAKRLKTQLDAFAYPKNLVWGFATLGYLALVGVVYPLVLLPAGTYSPIHKHLVVWLFVSGLGAVLIYIATQIKELLRK